MMVLMVKSIKKLFIVISTSVVDVSNVTHYQNMSSIFFIFFDNGLQTLVISSFEHATTGLVLGIRSSFPS